ncbi:MAG: hypothetical protein FWC91_04720 [Defluviitaleaceae bacterium]|nr:hypothetical protein [Defluviitaleaceae bacterium]
MRIGINGFGRIGRAIFRINMRDKIFDVPVINDINPDINNVAYMINYDTTYGSLQDSFTAVDGSIKNKTCDVSVCCKQYIDHVDWNSFGVDYVIDASGIKENLLRANTVLEKNPSVKKVFITHSPDEVDFTMVIGANENNLDVSKHNVISTSICDATAIAPILKLISENFELAGGAITTVHPLLTYQNVLDGEVTSWFDPNMIYSHYPLGRSVFDNIIPKPTTAIAAVFKVLPQTGIPDIASFSYRTPTTIVASADITLFTQNNTELEDVKKVLYDFEQKQSYKIIQNSEQPLVSLDYKMCEYSAVVDHRWLSVTGGKTLKLILWYDNEWGYASRVIDQITYVNKKLGL